jgi:hypothetical protein
MRLAPILAAFLVLCVTATAWAHHRPWHQPTPTPTPAPSPTPTPTPTPTPSPGGTVGLPATVDTTCATDETAELQAFVAAQPPGTTVVFPANGCIRVDGTLTWTETGLTLEGNGTLLKATEVRDGQRAHVKLVGGGGWTIRDLDVQGVNPSPGAHTYSFQWQHGYSFYGVSGAVLDDSETRDTYGDGYYVGLHPSSGFASQDITVINGRSERPGRTGVAVVGGYRVLIQGGYYAMAGLNIFDLEPNQGNTIDGVTFDGVTVGPWPTRQWQLAITGPPGSANPKAATVRNVTLRNSTFQGSPMTVRSDLVEATGQSPLRVSNVRVEGNTSDTVYAGPVAAVVAHHTDGLTATGNYQAFSGGQAFAFACASSLLNVTGNTIPGATGQLVTGTSC